MNFKAAIGAFAIWAVVANVITAPYHDLGARWVVGTLAGFLASLGWLREYVREQSTNKGEA